MEEVVKIKLRTDCDYCYTKDGAVAETIEFFSEEFTKKRATMRNTYICEKCAAMQVFDETGRMIAHYPPMQQAK